MFLLKEATKGSKVICYYSCYSYLRKCGLLRRRPIVFGGRAEAGSKRKGCPLSSAKFTNLFTVGCEINRTRISRRKFDGHLVNCESLRGSFSTWLTVMRFNLSSSGMIFEGMKMDFERFVAKVLDRFSVENLRILKVINIRDEDFEGLRMIDLDGEEKRVVRLG